MSDGEIKRKKLFDIYSNNLNVLKQNGILTDFNFKFDKTYICPICLNQFSEDALKSESENPLTLEDAPPKSLGGKANTLTCKKCNNTCGHDIDFHLVERMNEKDKAEFRPNTTAKTIVEKDGRKVQGTIEVKEDGTTQMRHSIKNNNPNTLDDFIETVSPNSDSPFLDINFLPTKVDGVKLQLALLKTGYLLTFEKFGYAFILDPVYNRIRQELLNPQQSSYPLDFWFHGPFPEQHIGVPFVTEKGLESILPIFPLTTKASKRIFATIIPLTSKPTEKVIAEFKKRFTKTKSFDVEMYAFDRNIDYLTDISAIKHLLNWINKIKLSRPEIGLHF